MKSCIKVGARNEKEFQRDTNDAAAASINMSRTGPVIRDSERETYEYTHSKESIPNKFLYGLPVMRPNKTIVGFARHGRS